MIAALMGPNKGETSVMWLFHLLFAMSGESITAQKCNSAQ